MSFNFRKLYAYTRDFGYTKDEIRECLENTAEKTGTEYEDIVNEVLDIMLGMQEKCIEQSKTVGQKKLRSYQEVAVKHMLTHRGMIAAFSTGTGKTITAVTVIACTLNIAKFLQRNIHVILVVTVSVTDHFKKEMKNYGLIPTDKRITFYTHELFGRRMRENKIDCQNVLLVIDEAHKFKMDYEQAFEGLGILAIGGSLSGAELAIKCASQAWKVMLLTATPMFNQTWDIANLLSMVKGVYPRLTLDPLDIYDTQGQQVFQETYRDTIMFQKADSKFFPSVKRVLYKIYMPKDYLRQYENLQRQILARKKDTGEELSNSFQVAMRAESNKGGSVVKSETLRNLVRNAKKNNERMIIYSEFIDKGAKVIKDILKEEGVKTLELTGKVSKTKRQGIIDEFNNQKPGKYRVFILTKAASVGVDLKEVRHVVLYEPQWNISAEDQVIGRGARFKSHVNLPENKRNVTVHKFLLLKPGEKLLYANGRPINIERYDEIKEVGDQSGNPTLPNQSVEKYMFAVQSDKGDRIDRAYRLLEEVQITPNINYDDYVTGTRVNKALDLKS